MAKQEFFEEHWVDENDNPAGGVSTGRGVTVSWQNGPLGEIDSPERRAPNGAFVEDIVAIAKGRIQFYQTACDGKFACDENAEAIALLEKVEAVLQSRTARRISEGTEGTHRGN